MNNDELKEYMKKSLWINMLVGELNDWLRSNIEKKADQISDYIKETTGVTLTESQLIIVESYIADAIITDIELAYFNNE